MDMTADSQQTLTVAMVAGEASGDALGAYLMEAIKLRVPAARFIGIGGPKMKSAGLDSVYPQEMLAVRGYAEVLRSLPQLLSMRRKLKKYLVQQQPDVFIGIDAPDFNLGLEAALKREGIPTVHYVSPSVWAWRPERIHRMKSAVDHVLALFPMESPLYQAAGIDVTFVGHPLAQMFAERPDREQARERLGIRAKGPVFALMPGSRMSEIEFMAELFLDTALKIHETYPDAIFLLPLVTRPTLEAVQRLLRIVELAHDPRFRPLYGHAADAMIAADGVLVSSGTATLEVALAKRPMVISYRVSPFTYRLVRRKLKIPYVGLPNILSERFVVPELLQDEATPENLAQALLNQYHDLPYRQWLEREFTQLHHLLDEDTSARAAEAVLNVAYRRTQNVDAVVPLKRAQMT